MSLDPAALGGLLPAAGALTLLFQGGRRSLQRRADRRAARSADPRAPAPPPSDTLTPAPETEASRRARREVLLHWILLVLGLGAIFALGKLI
ncbi:hypothetical protein SAMN05421763_103581 [[Luteovulum] sphaeroides subsp. megalophilum]|uniref:hypothetical protein n=1 Tax=Cereibacter sphaeroides TaxID=1063 RepID=UPI000B6C7DCD|nr:hypothetical protein [Cereibacter sphaeroides]AZB66019.1 hypothetical protein EBL87_20135 [Cereibacter sphaeroides]AZB70840.1 hypothetical protein EBL86_21080 [Cereibacter sphaeroides]SNS93664.1 hypothetical protein SAMN05421763_103581 [[Luteovulum] sphaeroides subsp. megalophilum]